MRPVPSIKGVRFDHNLCSCYHQIAMFAIFVPNFLSSSNLRLRKCHSCREPFHDTPGNDPSSPRAAQEAI